MLDEYAGLTTTFFPDNTRPEGNYFTVDERVGLNTFTTFVGVSSIPHTVTKGGNIYRYRQGIDNVVYDNVSGIASVSSNHGYKVNDIVELGDLLRLPVFTPDFTVELPV